MCVCERAYQLYCVSLSSPLRIAVLTAGYKGLFQNCKNKVHVVCCFVVTGVSEEQYYWALSVSPDSDYELHLKRPTDSCFINNYFIAGIQGFAANVDLQPVFNHYKCITYVCSYFSKDETECSQAITNAVKEAKNSNLNIRESLRKVGAAFLSTREVSAQECVHRCMPELWLRKIFPKTIYISTELPQNRVKVNLTN